LGADSRIFKHIELPTGFEKVCLDWIPHKKGESLRDYAIRLAAKIDHTQPFVVAGVSMGGMIAAEIASLYKPQLTILISSVPVHTELPPKFRFIRKFGLYKLVPAGMLKSASIIKRFFTIENKEVKKDLKQIIRDSDPAFINWAMKAILYWDNIQLPSRMVHIHGTKDEILPIRYTNPSHQIKEGTHLMIMSRPAEMNSLLNEVLRKI